MSERSRLTARFGRAHTLAIAVLFAAAAPVPRAGAQAYSVIHSFCTQPNDGDAPYGGLIADSAGNLYGTTYFGGDFGYGTVFEVSANGQEKVLYSFAGPPNDGSKPIASLARDAAGNLYGTTEYGGADDAGTAFELSADGTETILRSFVNNRRDGTNPWGGLLLGAAGELYGTTHAGGLSRGTIFQVSASAKEHVLYSFGGVSGDGMTPDAGLIRDSADKMYGTTAIGGAFGLGTVFEFGKLGAETVLYSFGGPPDGSIPLDSLVRDASGNLYGTTSAGGAETLCPNQVVFQGCGAVFKLSQGGAETVLYTFTGGADGGVPYGGLVLDPKGNLYGTASQGGSSANCNNGVSFIGCGVVFGVTAAGKEKVLHSFEGGIADGEVPYSGLVFTSGALYGTTFFGGAEGCGTVYKVTP